MWFCFKLNSCKTNPSFQHSLHRIAKSWEAVKKYFLEELPKQATEERTIKSLEKNEGYNRICRKLQDKSFPAQLAFLVSVEPIFKKFLCFFQNEGPLIHLLRDQMCEPLELVMHRFLKSQAIKDKQGKQLLTVEYFKAEIKLSFSQIEVGEKTRTALSKLTTDQHKTALKVSYWPSAHRQQAFKRHHIPTSTSKG